MKVTYNKNRVIIMLSIFLMVSFIFLDMFEDYTEGAKFLHLAIELLMLLLAAGIFVVILKEYMQEKNQRIDLQNSVDNLIQEQRQLKEQSRLYLNGLSEVIDKQFKNWRLTPSEQEVGFMLLKGFSLKEIAHLRVASEKTVHTQSQAIYKKSGIHGRSEFSAYFLEDLLPPKSMDVNSETQALYQN